MFTTEMLYALLQGLPADHLDFLDRPWYLLATRIQRGLKEGLDPPDALHKTLDDSHDWERQAYLRAFLHEAPVLALPDLTQRQKQALIALRYAGACSLGQLSRILVQDRSNTRRRMDALIEKGYVAKYFRRDGDYYLAISSPLDDASKSGITELMQTFKQALIEEQKRSATDESPDKRKNAGHKSSLPSSPSLDGEGSGVRQRSTTQSTSPTRSTQTTSTTHESSKTGPTIATRLPALRKCIPSNHHCNAPSLI